MGIARADLTILLAATLFVGVAMAACADTGGNRQASAPGAVDGTAACATMGTWIDPANRSILSHDQLMEDLSARPVVLLGEHHDDAEHHRWQLHTLAALHGYQPNMIIGFEAFPRRVQPVLDRWVAGELTSDSFLKAVDWSQVWGFDPDLYLPLFHFARQHQVPMLALNVDRELVSTVGREGFDAVPPQDREGISKPAPPSPSYRQSLFQVFNHKHQQHEEAHAAGTPGSSGADPSEAQGDPAFERFVEAQLTWDRAMAEAISGARSSDGTALVVAIIGRGHAEHRWGVPHQLADLGIADSAVMLPVRLSSSCEGLSPDLADAVFTLPPERASRPHRPRLGVMIETADGGARVTAVMPGSVADAAGLEVGDVILMAAGLPTGSGGDLIDTVRQQAPGTWLPLQIRRGGVTVEKVARFPARSGAT